MAVYKYKAMDKKGKKVEGSHTANSKNEVLGMLKMNNYYPLEVQEVMEGNTLDLSYYFSKVKTKEIFIFCRQFYTMLNAGATIVNCLDVLKVQTENKKLKKSLGDVYDEVHKGSTFSEALKKHKDIFPDLLINMVESGEVSGNLDIIMKRMAAHYEKENKLNNKIKGAMAYPIILGGMAVSVVVFLMVFIMPTFVGMFQGSGVELPGPTLVVLKISDIIQHQWYLLLAGILGITFAMKSYLKTEVGRLQFDQIKLTIPVIKSLNQKIIVSRFTRTLSTMLASGIPLINALEVVGRISGNKVVEGKLIEVREKAMKGVGLSEPIKETGIFPPMLYSMIRIGEESGTLDEILDRTADFYDEELEAALQTFTAMLEPLMIAVMGLVIGFIVISMMLPMLNMFKTVQ